MSIPSPLHAQYTRAGVTLQPYTLAQEPKVVHGAPAQADAAPPWQPAELVSNHGPLEFEYATMRRSAGLIDMAHRATVLITGADRVSFLQRMITQDLVGKKQPLPPLASVDSFWLNRKGRIDADLRLMLLRDRLVVDLDLHAVDRLISTLGAYVFAEDIQMQDVTQFWHRLGLHGPASAEILSQAGELLEGDPSLANSCTRWHIAGVEVLADHRPLTGERGYELTIPVDGVEQVHRALLDAGGWPGSDPFTVEDRPEGPPPASRVRPVGWHAFNIARIEAGIPLYYLDFGPDSLPHESSVVDSRIRFDKGCYLGQEIVARMQSLGHPKQRLVSLDLVGTSPDPAGVPQPLGGSPVLIELDGARESVGTVTSSTISPVLGGRPICMAMVRWAQSQPGTHLDVPAEGELLKATVRDKLRFWPAD
jgi:tRNA-modifying protein YgfZ